MVRWAKALMTLEERSEYCRPPRKPRARMWKMHLGIGAFFAIATLIAIAMKASPEEVAFGAFLSTLWIFQAAIWSMRR